MTVVYCPICHRRIDWDAAQPYRMDPTRGLEPLVRDPLESEESWRDKLFTSYRPCGEVGKPGTHMLPYDYGDYTSITIGMIGHGNAGKSHLLAAMISRLCSNDTALAGLGLQVGPLDLAIHQRYLNNVVTPLITHRIRLPQTAAAGAVEFCDALKVTNADNKSFAVTFFDLAGERLIRPNDEEVRFYASANALVFVVDPDSLPRRPSESVPGDASFEVALRRLESRPRPTTAFLPVAAAVVVAKADLVRFDDRLVADWLARGSGEEEVTLDTVEQESEDVYTYLTRRGARQWLRPAQECYRSTLHFASATNGPANDRTYSGTFRQCRVLKPLLSVFAMTGILDDRLLVPAPEGVR